MGNGRAVTILVVDDNPATRYSTGRFLRAAGFAVVEAATGQEALDKAVDSPDVVVLDVNLPDIDGFEVCRTLRTREQTARTPIIHLSATFMAPGDKVQGLEAGADGYLTHPVEPPVLIATVNAFLRARNAEEQMRRSETKFRAIFDQAVNGIALLSSGLYYLEVNPAMCRILGRTPDQIVGMSNTAFTAPGYEEQAEGISEELRLHGVWSGSLPVLRADGKLVELDWNISLHSEPDVRMAVVTDVTQRRAAEAERERLLASERAARSEAERANRLKDEFLATVSHELRSPLNAIVGWAHVLKRHGSLHADDYRAGIEAIDRNAKVQAQLIADLLDVSRITSGKLRLDLVPVELCDVVRNSVATVAQAAAAKTIAVEQHLPAASIHISGDAGRLQQIMDNLLTNAVKFTPKDGKINVRVDAAGGVAEIAVSDSGQGITRDFLPYIFDTFRQEDAATTRKHEGLGLGLAIVKRLVEMHGGSIAASSGGEGMGATFLVRLPTLANAQQSSAQPTLRRMFSNAGHDADVLRGLRLLVVDDDADARLVVRRLLVDYGPKVTEASSAAEALALLAMCDPEILISDISMPGDDGYYLIERIRAEGRSARDLPAIALTAFARPEDEARTLSRGFQAHLPKPVDVELLVTTIAGLARATERR
jgi:PAS domain S-box-containing protein